METRVEREPSLSGVVSSTHRPAPFDGRFRAFASQVLRAALFIVRSNAFASQMLRSPSCAVREARFARSTPRAVSRLIRVRFRFAAHGARVARRPGHSVS
jgi:hypothetical protein